MTLEELEEQLPNGLHDAKIRSITHSYEHRALIVLVLKSYRFALITRLRSGLPTADAVMSFKMSLSATSSSWRTNAS